MVKGRDHLQVVDDDEKIDHSKCAGHACSEPVDSRRGPATVGAYLERHKPTESQEQHAKWPVVCSWSELQSDRKYAVLSRRAIGRPLNN